MQSLDEIMDDFRRNGRECDFTPIQDPTDRTVSYTPSSPSWRSWPPENGDMASEKSSSFSVNNVQMKLARTLSSLSLAGAPTSNLPPQKQPRATFCQHHGGNGERCTSLFGPPNDSLLSADQVNVLNLLRGNPSVQSEFWNLVNERAQQLSEEFRSEASLLNGYDKMWSNYRDPSMNMHTPRNFANRGSSRLNNWEWYENSSISGRSSPISRDVRFDNRSSQFNSRNSQRRSFNRVSNVNTQRDAEMDRVTKDGLQFLPPSQSVDSSNPSTPEPLSSPEVIHHQEVLREGTSKNSLNGPILLSGRKLVSSQSLTPSPNGLADSSSSAPPSPSPPQDSTPLKDAAPRAKGCPSRRRRHSSETQPNAGCVFCKKNGETASVYRNHIAKDAEGRTVCQVLQKYVCPLCGATGVDAHTMKYCPKNLNPHPSPAERYRLQRGGIHSIRQHPKK